MGPGSDEVVGFARKSQPGFSVVFGQGQPFLHWSALASVEGPPGPGFDQSLDSMAGEFHNEMAAGEHREDRTVDLER